MEPKRKDWKRCGGVLCITISCAVLAVPFLIMFSIQFSNGRDWWEDNGKWDVQLPGDMHLYFALIMLNFAWAFGCMYYSMTFDSKLLEFDEPVSTRRSIPRHSGHSNPALDVSSDVYDTRGY